MGYPPQSAQVRLPQAIIVDALGRKEAELPNVSPPWGPKLVTTAVVADTAMVEPLLFVAVTATRTVALTSDAVSA